MTWDKVYFHADDKLCVVCGEPVGPVDCWPSHNQFVCDKPECVAEVKTRRTWQFIDRNVQKCTAPECTNFVPEGLYSPKTTKFACSIKCHQRLHSNGGKTEHTCANPNCGVKFYRRPKPAFKNQFHSRTCFGDYLINKALKRAGQYMPLAKEYLGWAAIRYRSLTGVRCALGQLLEFLNAEGISSIEDVTPAVITKFQASSGWKTGRPLGLLSTFFNWAIVMGHRKSPNPIIPRIHRIPRKRPLPRPYSQEEVNLIWALLAERGNARARAIIALAFESGARIGEIANARLQDLDLEKQRLFIRLPNKTMTERWAFFHDQTIRYMKEWLAERDPNCGHDFLFHNSHGQPCTKYALFYEFERIMCRVVDGKRVNDIGFDKWSFHRCRHTFGTNLARNGADMATIMAAGGWTTASAMTGYTKIDDEMMRRGYTETMTRIAEQQEPESVEVSFDDLVRSIGNDQNASL